MQSGAAGRDSAARHRLSVCAAAVHCAMDDDDDPFAAMEAMLEGDLGSGSDDERASGLSLC